MVYLVDAQAYALASFYLPVSAAGLHTHIDGVDHPARCVYHGAG